MLEELYKEAKEEQQNATNLCIVAKWGESLPETSKPAFEQSMNDDDFSHRSLFNLYRSSGAPFGLTSLKEHRTGNCSCR